jgi:galactose oxidase-like protein
MKKLLLFLCLITINHLMAQNVGVGTTNPQAKLSVGTNSEFRVDSVGDIARINNVPYTFPTTQGANGKTLVNDGSGNFTWKEAGIPTGAIIMCDASDTAKFISKGFVINGLNTVTQQSRIQATGNWTPFASTTNLTIPGGYYMQSNPTVWDGTEMLVYYNNHVYHWNPSGTTVTLSSTNTDVAFTATSGTSAVWDGTEMILFGGSYSNKGVKYNPTSDIWTPITNAPLSVTNQSAVWDATDNVMIVWGGDSTSTTGFNKYGYKYSPGGNIWSAIPISTTGEPSIRANAGAVWTGTQMIIFGGNYFSGSSGNIPLSDCYAYTPGTDSWTTLAAPFYGMPNPHCVWTGTDMLVWGTYYSTLTSTYYNFGYDYNVGSNSWTNITTDGSAGNNDDRSDVFWDGSGMWTLRGSGAQKFNPTGSGYFVEFPQLTTYYIIQKTTSN